MKFTKDIGNGGDFKEFDAEVLLQELIVNLGEMGDPQKWNLSTSDNEINVNILDDNLVTTGVAAIVKLHGSKTAIIKRTINSKKIEIKQQAQIDILKIIPEWKQANITARGVQLLNEQRKRVLTIKEEAELVIMDDVFNKQIKPIREASNLQEALVQKKETSTKDYKIIVAEIENM